MQVLFVHNNYPGQFIYLADALAKQSAKIAAIGSATGKASTDVQLLKYDVSDRDLSTAHPFARRFEAECRRAEQVIYAASALKASGFAPDVTVVHPGWGEALPIRDLFPRTKLIVYCEFFYRAANADVAFDPEFAEPGTDASVRIHLNNAATLLAMVQADKLYSPTRWQRQLFPEAFRDRIDVLHDGIDTETVRPDPSASFELPSGKRLTAADEVITFVSRDLEPYRGYHIFMRALPAVLKKRRKAQVVIVGGDGTSYGAHPPKGQTWKDIYLREVADGLDMDRVHFTGKLSYQKFLKVLQISSVHVYLTYPFVLSWSMLEAMSAGCLVIGSDTPPVAEVIRPGENGLLTPFLEPDTLAGNIIACLAKPKKFKPLREAARETMVRDYDLKTKCLPRLIDYVTS